MKRAIGVALGTAVGILGIGFIVSTWRNPGGDPRHPSVGFQNDEEMSLSSRYAATNESGSNPQTESSAPVAAVDNDSPDRVVYSSSPSENSLKRDLPSVTTPRGTTNYTVYAITQNAILQLVRDCPSRKPGGCGALSVMARSIVDSPVDLSGGWPEWMEMQLLDDLRLATSPNHFSEIGANCSDEGCVIYVAAKSSLDLPDRGSDKWRDEFEFWLSRRTWAEELIDSSGSAHTGSLEQSRIIGSTTHPYAIWYVLRRRP